MHEARHVLGENALFQRTSRRSLWPRRAPAVRELLAETEMRAMERN